MLFEDAGHKTHKSD